MILFLIFVSISISKDIWSIKTTNATQFAIEHNLIHIKHIAGFDIFESKSRVVSRSFLELPGLVKDKKRKHYTRDPLYYAQWHLHGNNFSVDIENINVTGKGVTVAIVDDGLQHDHPDLSFNYSPQFSHDFNGNDNDPNPYQYDSHGTSCGGVCCAAKNNICGRGVAHEASVAGIRLIAKAVYDYEEAEGLSFKQESIRIYSNSWGPYDDGRDLSGPGRITKNVLKKGFESGKNIYVWAGGNGRSNQDMSNYDGYANSPYTLAIGAIDFDGQQSYYSEEGANLLGVTPSSGSAGHSITTTTLNQRCTSQFGGTSSSAPLAAGIFALLLEARPDLRVRDIQHIVATYATKVNGGDWSQRNARGYTHSNEFGFGLLKVPALLEGARKHHLVPHPFKTTAISSPLMNIPISHTVHLKSNGDLSFIEQVLVTITMTHSKRGQVHVSLKSPHTESILAKHRNDDHNGQITWTYSSLRHWGEELKHNDDWYVVLTDDTNDNYTGTVQHVKIKWIGF